MPRNVIVTELEALGETCAEAENDPALRKRLLARILADSKLLNAFYSAHPIRRTSGSLGQFWAVSVDMADALRAGADRCGPVRPAHLGAPDRNGTARQ